MAGKLRKFQSIGFTSWKGLTSDNHLASLFHLAPQKASNLMVQLLAYDRGPSLETFLAKFPTKEFDNDEEYYWDVIGSSKRNIPLIEARTADGTVIKDTDTGIGIGGDVFYLVFGEDWFADGEVIFGNYNEAYPVRVLGDARFEGTNAVYKCEIFGNVPGGIPGERLQIGERFSVGFAPAEAEGSRKMGDVRFSSPVSMRNEWSRVRIQHKMWGNKMDKKLAFGIPMVKNVNGKQVKSTEDKWIHYADWEIEKQFQDYKNNAMMFGKSNRNANGEYLNFGKSGNKITFGDGIREQMNVSNVIYYNKFSLKLLEDSLYQLSAAKLGMNDRTFVIYTGEYGALLIHKAIKDEVSGWSMFTLDNTGAVSKTSSNLHSNALKAGFQFTEFLAPNGVKVRIQVDPMYDDPVMNKVLHPNGGVAESYRMDIFDIGSMEQPNIFKCSIKGHPEYRGYESGFRNPFTGQVNITNMSHDEDSATVHKYAEFGVCVLDPTRTLSLVPAILQA